MIKTSVTFRAQGERFSPNAVQTSTGLVFSNKNQPGQIGTTGRYRGKPIPYGSAELSDDAADLTSPSDHFFTKVDRLLPACLAAGATSTYLHIDVAYRFQCNIELSREFVLALARAGTPVTISCFEDDSIDSD